MKKYNYIVSVIMLAFSGYIFYETSTYDIGTSFQKNPAIWPQFLAAALALLSVALIVETLFTRSAESAEAVINWKSPGMKKVYIMLGLLVVFVVLLKIFGMLIALFLLIPAIEWVMGCRNRVMLIALPVGLVAFVYVFFVVIMKLTLPAPIWA